jgi:hypothetical protein
MDGFGNVNNQKQKYSNYFQKVNLSLPCEIPSMALWRSVALGYGGASLPHTSLILRRSS